MRGIAVDINVVMEALEGSKPDGSPAFAEAEFMFKLFGSHNRILVNEKIVEKYRNMAKYLDSRRNSRDLNIRIHKTLMEMVADSARTNYVDGAGADWPGLKKCDKQFVGVALQSGGMLVTGDARLRELLAGHRVGSRIECVTAGRALDMQSAWG